MRAGDRVTADGQAERDEGSLGQFSKLLHMCNNFENCPLTVTKTLRNRSQRQPPGHRQVTARQPPGNRQVAKSVPKGEGT